MIYGKRFCPCFFVQQDEEGKPTKDNRICPCKPALATEIKDDGRCHCQIYCTPEYASSIKASEEMEVAVHEHSRGLTKEECEELLSKKDLDADELEALLKARENGITKFILVDTREWMEYKAARIKGTDKLIPTTSFYDEMNKLDKETPIILYCHTGSRSAFCQKVLLDFKYHRVLNLTFGIVSYHGEIEKG
jgi:rhodanese-related sulfurtransferase